MAGIIEPAVKSWVVGLILAALVGLAIGTSSVRAAEIESGGPLAGTKLPSYATQHGEPPGYPGSIPGLQSQGKTSSDMGHVYTEYSPQGQAPELQLYPGAVEHWRAYGFKYVPTRSLFDALSQIKNWVAPNIPRNGGEVEPYAEPVYWVPRHKEAVNTGYTNKPVPAFRCKPGEPVFQLDLGTLDIGMYAVRVIGAVPTGQLRTFREPLYLNAKISDGPAGAFNTYRIRLGYVDEFYSIAEIYFHATEKRAYRAELTVGEGSKVDLLVHNITLDDALAGQLRQACKTRRTLAPDQPVSSKTNRTLAASSSKGKPALHLTTDQRLARDAALWENFPPVNHQGTMLGTGGDEHEFGPNVSRGVAGKDDKAINDEFGAWVHPGEMSDPATRGVFLVNKKLNLQYTMADLLAHKSLPAPYPFKDDGAGLYFPDSQAKGKGAVWAPIAEEVYQRIRGYYGLVTVNADKWQTTGDTNAARDAAVALARYAYAFPAIDYANFLVAVTRAPGPYGREYRCRRRETFATYLPHYPMYVNPIMYKYDALFDYIKDSQELADSIGRYVPWVKTPTDVIKLIDTYFVQTVAKRIMRYHYTTDPMEVANLAAVVGNTQVTDTWMDWLFSRTFIYPLPPTGVQDLMITGCERDGCQYIGSTYYAQGEGGIRVASAMDKYVRAGGNARFNLADPVHYPKPVAQCYWRIGNVVAGGDFLRIGDVCGPDKLPGHTLRDLAFARNGWEWTHDSKFAFIVKNYLKREQETDQEWTAIEQSAAQIKRAPWLDNRSRVMPMWAGVLEDGVANDDYRFRRAAYIRTGFGIGHAHNDTLDLQVFMHGLPATIDGGQRGGYSRPADSGSRVHNLVEVNGRSYLGYSWTRALSDATGAPYLRVQAEPPPETSLFYRQAALVSVDEGQGSQPVAINQQIPPNTLPANVTLPDAYVFDVFRVSGGVQHTYCFHGPLDDEFQWNAQDSGPVTGTNSPAAKYLGGFDFPEKKMAGKAPAVLTATWRQSRDFEKKMAGNNFGKDQPGHYTRLHLLGADGALAMRANFNCFQFKYDFSCLFAQRTADQPGLESAFAAIVEPYRGVPFIRGVKRLDISGNETDAQQAVAVEIVTTNGHTDICFADGRPEKVRAVSGQTSEIKVSGEFGYLSTDAHGLRQATLAGGALLETPAVKIVPAVRERTGRVVKVDYLKRALWIDQLWPAGGQSIVFEIGVPGHWTTYTAVKLEPDGDRTKITMDKGADYYRSGIEDIDPKESVVKCVLDLTMTKRPGIDQHWVASNEEQSNFWRADYVDEKTFKLSGAPVTAAAFGKANALRLWEYGVGDMVRHSTFVSLRRVGPGEYAVQGDVDAGITLAGGKTRNVTMRELAEGSGRVTFSVTP